MIIENLLNTIHSHLNLKGKKKYFSIYCQRFVKLRNERYQDFSHSNFENEENYDTERSDTNFRGDFTRDIHSKNSEFRQVFCCDVSQKGVIETEYNIHISSIQH